MKKLGQKGFSVVEVLIVVVVIGLIAVLGWMIIDNRSEKTDTDQTSQADNNQATPSETDTKEEAEKKTVSVDVVSTSTTSPNGMYVIKPEQVGDGYSYTLTDKSGKVIAEDFTHDYTKLSGYNKDWFCQCGGPEFKGWSSDDYFVLEIRAQSQDGANLLKYHVAVEAKTNTLLADTMKKVN